jgi:hypothetical protein
MPRSSGTLRAIRRAGQQGRVRSQLKGASAVRKLLRQLPASVKEEMADALTDIGPDYLRAQQADAPVAARAHRKGVEPGALRAGLSWKVLRASLRLRVGLLGTKRGRARLFYGFIVEVGRKAQTVTVTRKAGVAPYKMRVRAMAPRPFVYKKRPELRTRLSNRLNQFWEHALAHAGEGVGDD